MDEIRDAMRHSRDLERAKRIAFKDHLAKHYDFQDEDLRTMIINETKMANKGEESVIYASFENFEDVREIYIRQAEFRNDDLTVRGYVLPQFYERHTSLNKICKNLRENNPDLKTQLRFGFKDIEVFTKTKGEGEPYKQVNIKDLTEEIVPEFNHKIKWRKQTDRLPYRTNRGQHRGQTPAGEVTGEILQPASLAGPAGEKEKSMVRQRSSNSDRMETKKQRTSRGQDMDTEAEDDSI